MKLQTLRRNSGIAVAAIALSVSLAACGSDDESNTAADTESSSSAPETEESPAPAPEDSESTEAGAEAQTFGEGCAEVPTSGPGSFDGMVQDPVATAAGSNPILSTLVQAVGAVDGLGDTLNAADALTVFAPFDGAFDAVPAKALNGLLADQAALGKVLSHHVVAGQLDPAGVVGEQETLNADTLTVEGDETGMTVTDGTTTANVICGNVPTANATVYVIDQVMLGGTM